DRDDDEPDAHECRHRGARRTQGRRTALGAAGRRSHELTIGTRRREMLQEQLIQTAGFRNVGPADARTGFQLRIRSPYYRGLWADLIERPTVIVDDEEFDGRDIRWTLPDGDFSFAELQESTDARWPMGTAAVLTVPRDG